MAKKIGIILVFLMVLHGLLNSSARSISYLKNIRYYTYDDYTRVVLDLSAPLKIKEKVLPGESKYRLYFDMERCDYAPGYPDDKKKEIAIEQGHLMRIRLAKRNRDCVRVVFDFDTFEKYTMFYLNSPFRIVFDIFQDGNGTVQGKENIPISKPAQPVDNGYSIVRQLGLGVRTIVIDPGHGGVDPGTMNESLKLSEKEIALDIAVKLKSLFEKNSDYHVILTRSDDRYISLEERTAIANSKKGDIFLSIHLNSAPRKSARGIECYYLSMTTDPWSMQVAALENKVNRKSIGEMQPIVEQIVKHAKISESKVFTTHIQENLVGVLKKKYNPVENLGVKKAPFFVLAGARMPAVLAEVSFLSNRDEGKLLKTPAYRYSIAEGLYAGIISYIKSLGKK
jgi:N-acetylmuramoyl-L-alanine amidase